MKHRKNSQTLPGGQHPFLRRAQAAVALLLITFSANGAALLNGFSETLVANGLSAPSAMAFAPDGRIFVCEQGGGIRVIKNGVLLPEPFVSVSVDLFGERGLLGIAFDPYFVTNGYVYVYYTVSTSPRHNRVSRFTAAGDRAVPGSEALILQLNDLSSATNHNGGALHFGPDEKLYVAAGENANGANAQTLSNLLGKILRINPNGTIPPDNPFYTIAAGQNRAIWAYGLRNPYTFAFQPGTTRMFMNDVGLSTWEEIDEGIAGSNYGWPITEGPTNDPRFRAPRFVYDHTTGPTGGCAITGGAFYNSPTSQFPASYLGKYFFADFCSGWIRVLDPATNRASPFASGIANPVDLHVGADGALYYLARGSGAVFRIQFGTLPATPDFNADRRADVVLQNNSTGQRALWLLNGTSFVRGVYLPSASVPWNIVGTGDFDADGAADIVFQNGSQVAVWLMNSTSYGRSVILPRTPPDWSVATVGDFNSDRQPDLVLQNRRTGARAVWLMDGTTRSTGVYLPAVSTQWSILGVGDFNGDKLSDIVFQNSATGAVAVWFLKGTAYAGAAALPSPPANWKLAGVSDFNGDGKPDLLLQNISTGRRAVWLMNGVARATGVYLPGVAVQWDMRNR